MKAIGILLVIVGFVWGLVGFNMDVGIDTDARGYGEYAIGVPSRVVNIDRLERRRMHLGGAAVTILVGVILIGFGHVAPQETVSTRRACPECAESIQAAATKCRYCGASVTPLVGTAETPPTPLAPIQSDPQPRPGAVSPAQAGPAPGREGLGVALIIFAVAVIAFGLWAAALHDREAVPRTSHRAAPAESPEAKRARLKAERIEAAKVRADKIARAYAEASAPRASKDTAMRACRVVEPVSETDHAKLAALCRALFLDGARAAVTVRERSTALLYLEVARKFGATDADVAPIRRALR